MRAKSMVLILIALGCGLVASIAISQVLERGAGTGDATVETVQIYVATTDLDMNEQLTASNVRVEDWPKSKIPEGATTDFEAVKDKYARSRLFEGEPILLSKVADEISGPAITIPPGHRVCSLKVQMDTAVSGLVNPGDRVDIIGYFEESRTIPTTGTREILSNVRVFAVNSETEKETAKDGTTIVAKTVSLLVKQDQVARLMLATELGTLRLALRHPNEVATEDGHKNETATIESLLGTRSENADDQNHEIVAPSLATTPPPSAGSAAGGFMGFLAGLKGGRSRMPSEISTTTQQPAWKMVVLTPDGGTHFSWTDEHAMPTQDTSESSGLPRIPLSNAPVMEPPSGLEPVSPGSVAAPVADPVQEPEQEEEDAPRLSDD